MSITDDSTSYFKIGQPKNRQTGQPINRPTGKLANRLTGNGQATLELSAALIMVVALMVGSVKVFVWLNERIVHRQADYEKTRVQAGSASTDITNMSDQSQTNGVQVDESGYKALNIFG